MSLNQKGVAENEEKAKPLRHSEVHIWAMQLYIMLSSGIPVTTALESISRSDLPRIAPVCDQVARQISRGLSLSEAMAKANPGFSQFVLNLVLIGEKSGQISHVLKRISLRSSRRSKLERELKSALAYPVFLAIVSLGMAFFMAFYMFPKMLPFLTGLGVALPWPTRVLVWTTNNLSSGLLILTILMVGAGRLLTTSGDQRLQRVRDWLLFNSPVIGGVNQDRVYSDCLSDLHLMLEAGLDLMASLKTLNSTWPEHNERVKKCIQEIRAGAFFSDAVEKTEMLPHRFWVQIRSGEETGTLPDIFSMTAENLDEMVALRVTAIVGIVEPAIFLALGFVAGFIVMATFLPLYSLTSSAL